MMHPHTEIINMVLLCRITTSISGLVHGMNEVNIKQSDSSNINNSLYKELLNDSRIIVYEIRGLLNYHFQCNT